MITHHSGTDSRGFLIPPNIAIAHDYLQQTGGAERVVAEWSRSLPASPIHTLAYRAAGTYPEFADRTVQTRIPNNVVTQRVEYLLPLLPALAHTTKVDDADVALVSTSGWAHQFSYSMPTVAYVHSPARWLYEAADYRRDTNVLGRTALNLFSSHLRERDSASMARMDVLFANSKTTHDRIHRAYGLDSHILHPPVSGIQAEPVAPARPLPQQFALVVSRRRGYKNITLGVDAARLAAIPVVVVGAGTEAFDSPGDSVYALGLVTDNELRWLYQQASVLIGSSHEDFGLTPLEANCEGTPVAAIPFGGYLETVIAGHNGVLSTHETPRALAAAITDAISLTAQDCRDHATRFSAATHLATLTASIHSLLPSG